MEHDCQWGSLLRNWERGKKKKLGLLQSYICAQEGLCSLHGTCLLSSVSSARGTILDSCMGVN